MKIEQNKSSQPVSSQPVSQIEKYFSIISKYAISTGVGGSICITYFAGAEAGVAALVVVGVGTLIVWGTKEAIAWVAMKIKNRGQNANPVATKANPNKDAIEADAEEKGLIQE